MPWSEGSSSSPGESSLGDLVLGTVWAGIGTLGAVAEVGIEYLKDPKKVTANAKQFAQEFGRYTPNNREWFFSDPLITAGKNRQRNIEIQGQQLLDARYRRSQWIDTGFDDETDNRKDDKVRYKAEAQESADSAYDRDKNSYKYKDNSTMATPDARYSKAAPTPKAAPTLKAAPQTDYRYKADLDSEGSLYNYRLQSGDRKYAVDKTSDVNYKLGLGKNQNDLTVGLDKNAVTRDVGKYTSDNQLVASNYKSYSDLQAALNKNSLQSGDNRYDTTTKYQTQKDINVYNRNTLDKTDIAKEQIKAGTYGVSQDTLNARANDNQNFQNWKRQNDANFDYTERQNAAIKLGQDMGQAQRAYSDQRMDRQNDANAASARWQHETAVKAADRSQFYADQKAQRDQQRADFGLRSQQIQAQINAADRDYGLKASESYARVNQINTDVSLRSQQFAATRGDVVYNRTRQRRSLAF